MTTRAASETPQAASRSQVALCAAGVANFTRTRLLSPAAPSPNRPGRGSPSALVRLPAAASRLRLPPGPPLLRPLWRLCCRPQVWDAPSHDLCRDPQRRPVPCSPAARPLCLSHSITFLVGRKGVYLSFPPSTRCPPLPPRLWGVARVGAPLQRAGQVLCHGKNVELRDLGSRLPRSDRGLA